MLGAVGRAPGRAIDDLAGRPTLRRAGVFQRALRRDVGRLRDPHRIAAILIFIVLGGLLAAGIIARGEAAGSDARAYWAAVRIWLGGGDPYHPTGPFLPYVYPPWMLPLFAPWALLPWDVAWFVWRGLMVLLLLWTIHWAYSRRHLETALVVLLLAFPIAANIDTGNITLMLAFLCWAAQFSGPVSAGAMWAIATWMKWVPAPLFIVLGPRARLWGLAWLAICVFLSLITLPLTIVQFDTLFGFGPRPIRLDYLALLWAVVPWWWRHPRPLWWLVPSAWRRIAARLGDRVDGAARRRGTG